jgi:hypothetical protein
MATLSSNCARWSALLAIALGCGCASTAHHRNPPLTGDLISDGNRMIATGPARDRVLWEYRLSSAALQQARYGDAQRHLDDALREVEGIIGARDHHGQQARSVFGKESKKTFLGEPYERVMAYYYRALLYWREGDLDNARACYRSGQLQDADAEHKEFACDYVLLDYLEGLINAKLRAGNPEPQLKQSQALSKIAVPPAYDPAANVLFFIEYGSGPAKYSSGAYGEQLRFRPGYSTPWEAQIKVANQRHRVGPYDDLTFQATTRGGRVMDHVLANKAVFKATSDTIGNAAIISGAVLAGQRNTQEAGLGVLAFGLLSKIVSASATPEADVRAWDNLPQYLTFSALRLAPGNHEVIVEFLDKQGQTLPNFTKKIMVNVPALDRDTVVFVSDRSPPIHNL